MRADRAYRLLVTKEGRGWRRLATTHRVDRFEVVDIAAGEVVLFWDCAAPIAPRFERALRADLAHMEDDEFLHVWSAVRGPDDLP